MMHILGEFYHHDVLGVDVGSASTTVAASIKGLPYLNVFPTLGHATGIPSRNPRRQ